MFLGDGHMNRAALKQETDGGNCGRLLLPKTVVSYRIKYIKHELH